MQLLWRIPPPRWKEGRIVPWKHSLGKGGGIHYTTQLLNVGNRPAVRQRPNPSYSRELHGWSQGSIMLLSHNIIWFRQVTCALTAWEPEEVANNTIHPIINSSKPESLQRETRYRVSAGKMASRHTNQRPGCYNSGGAQSRHILLCRRRWADFCLGAEADSLLFSLPLSSPNNLSQTHSLFYAERGVTSRFQETTPTY